jgi:hypothetical protein
MRVAVLILASLTPRALFATAQYFAPSDVDVFVHVDAKTDLADYLRQTDPYPPRVKFLEARRRVYWGGFSMVEATLDLLREAVRAGPYDRYVFISDNSLPVQPLDGFFAQLAASEDMIETVPTTSRTTRGWYEDFYLTDDDLFDYRRSGLHPRPVDAAMQDQLERMLKLKARGKKPGALFHGQASWALSSDSVRLVLDTAENDPWWVESCRFALFSDETFFHTIVGAAKYPDGVHDSPTYTDNFRFFPRVIAKSLDLPFDMHPHFLFLRKIAPDFAPDLPETCLRLYAGVRHMLAHDPAVRGERVIAVSEGGVPHLHLLAPIEDDSGWGERGNRKGRRFRYLKADAAVWRLRAPANWRRLRLSLPCVIGGGDAILPNATFEIDGMRLRLEACDIGYRAEFHDIPHPFDTITLHLPKGGRPDLFVAAMPEA